MDFATEIKRLQKLSCIALSPEQEEKLWKQINDIISFLGQLPDTGMKNEKWIMNNDGKLSLRTIVGIKEDSNSKKIMKNVKHGVVNNSIVIKSVLN